VLCVHIPRIPQDESYRYVLPNHMLFHVAELVPTSVPALLACCNPVPPLVRINAEILIDVITAARAEPSLSEGSNPSDPPLSTLALQTTSLTAHAPPHTHTHTHDTTRHDTGGVTPRWETSYRPLMAPTHQRMGPSAQQQQQAPPIAQAQPAQSAAVAATPDRRDTTSPTLSKDELYSTAGTRVLCVSCRVVCCVR
jgi:hypothetical protein